MYCLAAFFIIGALGTTPSVLGLDLDCFDENALESEMTKCFTQSGLSVDAHTVADVQTAILTNTSYVCRNTEAFKSAVSCVMGFARNCLISLWVDPAILPDANKMTDGLVYLCHHLADVDAKCFIGTLPTIAKCTRRKARAAHSVSDSDRSLKFIFCKWNIARVSSVCCFADRHLPVTKTPDVRASSSCADVTGTPSSPPIPFL
ncbi:uncharacterized protein [Littorina saxatilis]|uniref:uncharacterized protein isoform X2 n=1 Tax=Littorina saxatilis TaxID=31220 RepID=UPI0038B51BDC